LTKILHESDLLALRDAVIQLGRAVAVSDRVAVEESTAQIRNLVNLNASARALEMDDNQSLVREVAAYSEEIAALLASRLRAFDIAIAAWRDPGAGR